MVANLIASCGDEQRKVKHFRKSGTRCHVDWPQHPNFTVRATLLSECCLLFWWIVIRFHFGSERRRCVEQFSNSAKLLVAVFVSQKAIVTNSHESIGQHVHHETADELRGLQCERASLMMPIIFVSESDFAIVDGL